LELGSFKTSKFLATYVMALERHNKKWISAKIARVRRLPKNRKSSNVALTKDLLTGPSTSSTARLMSSPTRKQEMWCSLCLKRSMRYLRGKEQTC